MVATPVPSRPPPALTPASLPSAIDPAECLSQARQAAARNEWRQAGSLAQTALQNGLSKDLQPEAQAILLETSVRIGDYRGARLRLQELDPPVRQGLIAEQLQRAGQAAQSRNYQDAILRARLVVEIEPANTTARELLAESYLATDQGQLAMKELEKLPESGARLKELRAQVEAQNKDASLMLARRQLELASTQARQGQWSQAGISARKAGQAFVRLGPYPSERARALAIEAQAAAHRREWTEAARLMQSALELKQRPEYAKLLAEYQEQDRYTISREEIVDVDHFAFPPARTGGKVRSQLTLLGARPDNPIAFGNEHVYTDSSATFTATGGPALLTLSVTLRTGPFWKLTFSGPGRSDLKPGLYESASSDEPDAAGVDISGLGRGASHYRGKFLIHEIAFDPAGELKRFAADFVVSPDGHAPYFGQIRYRSSYR